MAKILKKIFNCILVLLIVVLVGYFSLRIVGIVRIYNVETGSMEDKIHSGDYILLLKKNQYYVGDVVTYKVDSYFITHRIIEIDGNKITTKGDANNVEDNAIDVSQIEGKVIYWGGLLNFAIKFKYIIAIFLIGLYLLSCYFEDERNIKKDNN